MRWWYTRYNMNMETIELNIGDIPITGRMSYLIGNFRIDRDEYWSLTDSERQKLHDIHDPDSRAMVFNPKFIKE